VDSCDVLVVGGGPAGSSCAWGLRDSGLSVVVLDRARFPRDKVCAGWITPQVLDALAVDPADYRKERILEPIHGFCVSRRGDAESVARHGSVVSYGVRRCEFDHYLLERCAAHLRLGEPLRSLRRDAGCWIVNESLAARLVVGAGGHFCPVARHLGARPGPGEPTVVAREIEFEMTRAQSARCAARPELPELFFEPDLRGYGWLVRKGDWLNVGLGRQDTEGLPAHVDGFLDFLVARGRVPADMPRGLRGHAYLLYDQAPRPLGGDAVLLLGDAAGLAYGRSGEGIRPAVESGLLAARALRAAAPSLDQGVLSSYEAALARRFGRRHGRVRAGLTDLLPPRWRGPVVGRLLGAAWFARRIVVDRWFLHREIPTLAAD